MNERLDYSAPKAEVLVVQSEGVICSSPGGAGNEDEIRYGGDY